MIEITKYGNRNWAIYYDGELLAVTVYKKGAMAVATAIRGLIARSIQQPFAIVATPC